MKVLSCEGSFQSPSCSQVQFLRRYPLSVSWVPPRVCLSTLWLCFFLFFYMLLFAFRLFLSFCFCLFDTQCQAHALFVRDDFELLTLQSLPPGCKGYRCTPPCPAALFKVLFSFSFISLVCFFETGSHYVALAIL